MNLIAFAAWPALAAAATAGLATLIGRADRPCTCGHTADTHRHYRPGNDCGLCNCGSLHTARVAA